MRLVPFEGLLVQIKQIEIEGKTKYMIEMNLGLMNMVFDKEQIDSFFIGYSSQLEAGKILTLPQPMRVIPTFE